jgi:hypothetical protein
MPLRAPVRSPARHNERAARRVPQLHLPLPRLLETRKKCLFFVLYTGGKCHLALQIASPLLESALLPLVVQITDDGVCISLPTTLQTKLQKPNLKHVT